MTLVFQPLLDKRRLALYMDDICCGHRTLDDAKDDLRAIFQCFRDNKLYAKLSKCEFFVPELNFLGHRVSAQGVGMDPRRSRP